MVIFIDNHKNEYGVEPICRVLPIAPSTYYRQKELEASSKFRSTRSIRDDYLKKEILRIWEENYRVYGVVKVWKQLNRENIPVARCTVERLMKVIGIRGARRGRPFKTTIPEMQATRPMDLVEHQFKAQRPNQLWVADITYVRTRSGFVFTSFVIDVFSNGIVGWKVSNSLKSELALDALEQAINSRAIDMPLIHHSDRGV